MTRSLAQLRNEALQIWQAGVAAVQPETLFPQVITRDGQMLLIEDDELDLKEIDRIVVIGAGKAGASMASALENVLGADIAAQHQLTGWVNVPADCVRPLRWINLHAARPAGQNEPTVEGVRGATEILQLVAGLTPRDLCIGLWSGGGSALLPAPVPEISLADKLAVTKHLSAAGADIQELNTVRKQLSRIKGGGLAQACRAGRLVSLIISDVLGDPLDVIASGPTVPNTTTAADALQVLKKFHARAAGISPAVFQYLEQKPTTTPTPHCVVTNHVLGNNAVAVDGAGIMAESLGYSHAMISAKSEGTAEEVGRHLAQLALRMRNEPGPNCLITGGEPTVQLAPAERRGLGGRNQQLTLAALLSLQNDGTATPAAGIVLLSGGTDGEDGPTDAAGAWCDAEVIAAARQQQLDPVDFLARNDAYHFFQATNSLLKTGPTHTNVCDLRVIVVDREG